MALDKTALKAAIKTAAQDAIGVDDDFDTFAQNLADAIDAFVKTGNATGTDSGGDTHNLVIS